MNALVNPNKAPTTYYFQHGTTTSYGKKTPVVGPVTGTKDILVTELLSVLNYGSKYHYRIVAENSGGISYGDDQSFTTLSLPTVSTGVATAITGETARLNATVDPNGSLTYYRFQYGPTDAYGYSTSFLSAGSGTTAVNVSEDIAGLSPGSTYHFRIEAYNGASTSHVFGSDSTFTTPPLPIAITLPADGISHDGATLNGTIHPNGNDTAYYFEMGLSNKTLFAMPPKGPILGHLKTTPISVSVDELQPGTTYYYRLVGENVGGIHKGSILSFETLAPTATTGPVAYLTPTTAGLTGTVDPNGVSTTYYFQYGLTTAYGSTTATGDAGSGTKAIEVSRETGALALDTNYHYRLVAVGGGKTVYGSDRTFASAAPPEATTSPASTITSTSAMLNGTVNPRGLSTVVYFEYGATSEYGSTTARVNAGDGLTPNNHAVPLSHLDPGSTYHYRLVAINSLYPEQPVYGGDKSFSTTSEPVVQTGNADNVTGNTARLTGSGKPNGIETVFFLEYGTDASFGNTVKLQGPVNGTKAIDFVADITGLSPDTLYHYRFFGDYTGGTAYGSDGTFYTSEENFRFKRMWPTLQQPWYFFHPEGIAVDNSGYVYIADEWNHSVYKLTLDGNFLAKWGNPAGNSGSADGEFNYPRDIAVDDKGRVFVADSLNSRIQIFSSDGEHLLSFGDTTQFHFVYGIEVDSYGGLYVADGNNYIWRFHYRTDKYGDLEILPGPVKWGGPGSADGQFNGARGIAIDQRLGNVYITDWGNDRVQKFTTKGVHLETWYAGPKGTWAFNDPWAITVGPRGYVYVTEYGGNRILKLRSNGELQDILVDENGYEDGELYSPRGVAVSGRGIMYVADTNNNRVQLFTSKSNFLTQRARYLTKWASNGSEPGFFKDPQNIAVETNGNVYVSDGDNFRVQKFSSEGEFDIEWGSNGSGPVEFGGSSGPQSLAVDNSGHVYVLDKYNHRVQKFTTEGDYVTEIGDYSGGSVSDPAIAADVNGNLYITAGYKEGGVEGITGYIQKFSPLPDGSGNYSLDREWNTNQLGFVCTPSDIAVDNNNNLLYAIGTVGADPPYSFYAVQVYTLGGDFVRQWYQPILNDSGYAGFDVAVDDNGFLYTVDRRGNRVYQYTSGGYHLITEWQYEEGFFPHQLKYPALGVDGGGDLFMVDRYNNRVQKFEKYSASLNTKAIVVAGGGPFPGNNLWEATRMSTHFAYRTLSYQGYSRDRIWYLSSTLNEDLDGNGIFDDIDALATNDNLETAITNWAADSENLVIYLADHGGDGHFRMNETETLSAEELSSWLNQLQSVMSGRVIVIYEACDAGSFLQPLSGNENRIVITSTSPGESAYFLSQGSVSYSNFFWTQIFNGSDLQVAFSRAQSAIGDVADFQNPLMDTDGDGIDDASSNYDGAAGIYIGSGTDAFEEAPVIGSVVPADTISGERTKTIYAEDVADPDGIARVWAIIRPPGYSQASPDNPIQELPSIDLLPVGNERFEATYNRFLLNGTYQIAIYARDRVGNTSLPVITTVSVNQAITRKAVIIATSNKADPLADPLWPSVEYCANAAYSALTFQGYTDEDIYFMSPVTFAAGVDTQPSLSNLNFALGAWAQDGTEDAVVYLVGHSRFKAFRINDTETLTPGALDTLLDSLQAVIPGRVTVVIDASYAGSFLPGLAPTGDQERILIAATGGVEQAEFLSGGTVSFSTAFWGKVLNGVNVRDAFLDGKNVSSFALDNQNPALDDDGSGVGNEETDGELSRYYTIGMGILLSGNAPQSGSISADIVIGDGSTTAEIGIAAVTSTGTVNRVFAVISPPSSLPPMLPGDDAGSGKQQVDLVDDGSGNYSAILEFDTYGLYRVAIFVEDAAGNLSPPKTTTVFQSVGPDVFESDNTKKDAGIINPDTVAQKHNFHDEADEDWVRFYAMEGESYDIVTNELGSNCDTTISIQDKNGLQTSNNLLTWTCPASGIYHVKIVHSGQVTFGPEAYYSLSIDHMKGGVPGDLVGQVIDNGNYGIGNAAVLSTGLGSFGTLSYPNGYYIMTLPSGIHTILTTAAGYEDQVTTGVEVLPNNSEYKDIVMASDETPATVTINYSTKNQTNGDVTATITSNETITITNNDGSDTYTFTENGSFTFEFTDLANNSGTVKATVSWIDKEAPIATISYEPGPPMLTNQSVTATIALSDGTITSEGGESHIFNDNGEFIFEFTDAVGNTGSIEASVDWIDKDPPAATVSYSTTAPTNQDVTASLIPDESITVTNNGGSLTKLFTVNDFFTFTFQDDAGNPGSVTATVNNIDRVAPTCTISYYPSANTNQDVTATATLDEGQFTNVGGGTHILETNDDSFTFTFEDTAGNSGSCTAQVDYIDKTPPTPFLSYSTKQPTKQDVTVTLTLSDGTVTSEGGNTHTFTANGSHTFDFEDTLGNSDSLEVEVNWIDKTPPTWTITYSTEADTNQDVTATITLSDGTVTSAGGDTHIFPTNGTHTFEFEDEVGNRGSAKAEVDWIDRTLPTATFIFSTTDPTNQDVVVTLDPDEAVTVTNNGGLTAYTFADNGDFTFSFEDAAGNSGTATAVVDWIDRTAPSAAIDYSTTDPTNQKVTATLNPDEPVTVTNNGGSTTYTFTDNDTFTFEFTDAAGNTGTADAEVTWIDKTEPTAAVTYSIIPVTNQDVVATIEPSEAVTVTNNDGLPTRTFTQNGSFVFEFVDAAGNTGSATATVSNIDKIPPEASIDYAPATATNQPVVATLTLTGGFVTSAGGNTHTFTENGAFTFTFEDTAGNTGSAVATVDWIDTTPSDATITYSTTSLTNQDVVATITLTDPGGIVTSAGGDTHTFTANGSFTFTFEDSAQNPGTAFATVNWIDKAAPTADVAYSTTAPTNQNVQAVLQSNEAIIITNNGGSETRTFTQDGVFTFEFTDAAGNTGTADAEVTWIDKTPPTATVAYSTENPTKENVTVTIAPSEDVTMTNNGGALTRTFANNGVFTFTFSDAAGNGGTATATVTWIDKIAPAATITYSTTDPTNQDVTATLDPSEPITVTNNDGLDTYIFTDIGTFTFEFTDAAGNTGSATATVANIDRDAPTAELSGAPLGTSSTNTVDITVGGGVVAYKYKLDGGAFGAETAASTPISLTDLAEGAHTLSVIGKDAAGNWQAEVDATTASWTVVCKGNLNGDDAVDLADVMTALKALAGVDTSGLIRPDYETSGADINGDGKVGVAEVLYMLQELGGLR
jgi:hypothetical protein